MMKSNAELNLDRQGQTGESTLSTKPFAIMSLDLLGFVVIFAGLAQQYGRIDVLPHSLSFSNSGLIIAVTGLVMTLPFLAWSLKASATALDNISV